MSSVWLCIPSKRPPEEAEKVLELWRERGYKIALWIEDPYVPTRDSYALETGYSDRADVIVVKREYPGYAKATNGLVLHVLRKHNDCDWVVLGGDDMEPDIKHSAEEIARQCTEYFHTRGYQYHVKLPGKLTSAQWATFGVMQPTGDRWGDKQGAYADRVCGSPWIGREFALRINQGKGPLWPEYFHMYEDEELFCVAQKYGVLWQRRDLIHLHNHWARTRGRGEDMPEFLKRANSPEEWRKAKALFYEREAKGFPGSEPL